MASINRPDPLWLMLMLSVTQHSSCLTKEQSLFFFKSLGRFSNTVSKSSVLFELL